MFKRFTERARNVVVQAQDEARRLKHDYLGTEHLLLGLLRVEEGLAARALDELGVELDDVRGRVAALVGEGDEVPTGQIPFSPRAKKVLELALREAISLDHNYIGTEHILLGLVRKEEGTANRVLLDLDVDAEMIRNELMRMLSDPRNRRRAASRSFVRAFQRLPAWEYRVDQRDEIDAAWLNELGAEGWELVDVSGARCIFKRRCAPPGELRAAS